MKTKKKDVACREDVVVLIDRFYERVQRDALLGPVFAHVHWPDHLPTMYNFWSSMLLGDQTYRGNPLQRHLHLNIDKRHFDQWLELFNQTIDEHFEGEKASEAKSRAQSIAGIFQFKMGLT